MLCHSGSSPWPDRLRASPVGRILHGSPASHFPNSFPSFGFPEAVWPLCEAVIQAEAGVHVQPGGWWRSPWWCPHAAPLCLSDRNLNILQYCPSADLWTLFETCDVHIRKQQMVSVEETIYIVGGCLHELGPTRRGSQSEDMLTVQSYNTATRQWLYLKENTSKSGLNLTCALHNDGIYIMSRDVTLSTSLEHRVFLKYNIFSDSWEAFRRFPAFGHNLLVSSLYLPNKTET